MQIWTNSYSAIFVKDKWRKKNDRTRENNFHFQQCVSICKKISSKIKIKTSKELIITTIFWILTLI